MAIRLSHNGFLKIDKDYKATATAADLRYVSDQEPGISRTRRKGKFIYYAGREPLVDPAALKRIAALAIPPAWTSVWICRRNDGHLQATGFDACGRKQYRYHPKWHAVQAETKFHRMHAFGKALPVLRRRLQHDLAAPGFPENKVMAMLVSLMEKTYIRIGNNDYEKLYGSYGLSTMKNRHVNVQGNTILFSFRGKKGVYQKIEIRSKRFARIIKQCKSIPGSELFQYYDGTGALKQVDSGQVNRYIRECLSHDFTTKDFRTWAGTLMMLRGLRAAGPSGGQTSLQDCYRQVSEKLGNTVAVCKKYYVHPELAALYLADRLSPLLADSGTRKRRLSGLSVDESVLMKVLALTARV